MPKILENKTDTKKKTLDALNDLFNAIFGRRLEMVVEETAWFYCYRYEMLYKWLGKQEVEPRYSKYR